jgi:transaldolase
MKFFIDTANLKEIKEAQDLGVLDGVTTNPSLMAKEGIFAGMIKEGEELVKIDPKIVVKVPMIKDGVRAIKYFTEKGIRTNCTLVFTAGQALLAAKAGATYVSPFVGRLDDIATDGLVLIAQIRQIYDNYGYETEILAASVRHTMHLLKCAEIGADVVTCPLNVITSLLNHPLTDSGLAKFLADHKKANG